MYSATLGQKYLIGIIYSRQMDLTLCKYINNYSFSSTESLGSEYITLRIGIALDKHIVLI